MKICVVGTGYVGLVVGTCFAESGHDVIGVDQDGAKIKSLNLGHLPIYEPGLKDVLLRNQEEGRLHFTTDLKKGIKECPVIFITVGTPSKEGGAVDLQYVLDVAKDIGQNMQEAKTVVIKSTVPCGSHRKVEEIIKKHSDQDFDVVVNPEFLKEGVALDDFMRPDRVVVGLSRDALKPLFERLYGPFLRTGKPLLFMDPSSAEMTKYAANGLLALRISYMNEIANLCDCLGADVEWVRKGLGSDGRIGHSFLFPGVGYGGSCFPKDVEALVSSAEEVGYPLRTLSACTQVNQSQQKILADKIKNYFKTQKNNSLDGKKIAIWGLSFKPKTDDIREAPALKIIEELIQEGAIISAFDPVAMEAARAFFKKMDWSVDLCSTAYDAAQGVDALALVTEWNEFRRPDFHRLKEIMNHPAIFDGRNIYDPLELKELEFHYEGIGRRLA